MKQQILTIQVGNAGIQLGQAYWNQMLQEHNQNDKSNQTLFDEITGQQIARCILIDQDSSSIDKILQNPNNKHYNPDNLLPGKQGAQNLFSHGYHIQDIQYLDSIIDKVQKVTERLDNLHAVQLIYSIAGGCGSGLGSKLSEKIIEYFPNNPFLHHIIFPNDIEMNPVAPYNSVLAFHRLVENSQTVFLYQNQTILNSNMFNKDLNDVNKAIARIMSNHTCSMRFNGLHRTDCLKFQVQTNPFPRLHFFSSNLIPLKEFDNNSITTFDQMTERITNKNYSTYKLNQYQRILSGQIVFRGDISSSEAENQQRLVQKNLQFVEWLPDPLGIQHSFNGRKQVSLFLQGSFLLDEWKRVQEEFTAMFRRKTYLHAYLCDGMDEMDFTEAESNFNDLHSEYQPNGDPYLDEEEEGGAENDNSFMQWAD